MTLPMCCNIVFDRTDTRDSILLRRVTEAEFESTWKELTTRGTITLPRALRLFDRKKLSEVFRQGDRFTIFWGYRAQMWPVFTGYITRVSADIPVVIEFEDEMYKVRRLPVNFSHQNIGLEKLLKTIVPGYEIDALEGVQLGAVRLPKTQVGPVLEKLKSEWGLYTYMKGTTLVCGKYYADNNEKPKEFHLERNCVSTSLNYKKKEDIQLKIKCVSTLRNGTKLTVDNIGDKEGNERQLTFYNITVEAELKRLGMLEYQKYKQDRFDGSFTAFGFPDVSHGMKVKLVSQLYPDRQGTYYVERVKKTFGPGGIRQEITLGDKVA